LSEEEKRKTAVDWNTGMDVLPDYHIEQRGTSGKVLSADLGPSSSVASYPSKLHLLYSIIP